MSGTVSPGTEPHRASPASRRMRLSILAIAIGPLLLGIAYALTHGARWLVVTLEAPTAVTTSLGLVVTLAAIASWLGFIIWILGIPGVIIALTMAPDSAFSSASRQQVKPDQDENQNQEGDDT